ncbi:hypothetical protein, partial [Bacteroides xylanisolvens]|uniref:hypothetical protein n=1 Tax=Bacteroides xylanisolvens TaxID=371601 RepID=UPI00319E0E4D
FCKFTLLEPYKQLYYNILIYRTPLNFNGHYQGELGKWQANPIIESRSNHLLAKEGKHTLRIRPLDPGIVFEKIQINTGGLQPSYLGAPETLK